MDVIWIMHKLKNTQNYVRNKFNSYNQRLIVMTNDMKNNGENII